MRNSWWSSSVHSPLLVLKLQTVPFPRKRSVLVLRPWFPYYSFQQDLSASCSNNYYFPARRLILVLRPIQPHLGFVTIYTESCPNLVHWRPIFLNM